MSKIRPKALTRITEGDRRLNIVRKGVSRFDWNDLYHLLLTLSWMKLLTVVSAGYVIVNALFAVAYLMGGDGIENARPGSFLDAFFFSIQTMASIGYGAMYPTTVYANILVTIESLIGLLAIAIGTGLMFARFSLPKARVMFSQVAVIAPRNGIPNLMFRVANERRSWILEAQVNVTVVRSEISLEGDVMRRFYEVPLVRSRSPLFSLTWTVMHPIDESSPLYGVTLAEMLEDDMEIVVTLTGIDQTMSDTIHAQHSFLPREIINNYRFVDILSTMRDGRRSLDYTRFHDVEPIQNL